MDTAERINVLRRRFGIQEIAALLNVTPAEVALAFKDFANAPVIGGGDPDTMKFKGQWTPEGEYAFNDIVTDAGHLFAAVDDVSGGQSPSTAANALPTITHPGSGGTAYKTSAAGVCTAPAPTDILRGYFDVATSGKVIVTSDFGPGYQLSVQGRHPADGSFSSVGGNNHDAAAVLVDVNATQGTSLPTPAGRYYFICQPDTGYTGQHVYVACYDGASFVADAVKWRSL